jgi:hypothetical protein
LPGDTGEQIREHRLACSVINLHGTEDCVFDQANLDFLKRFTDDISIENRDKILEENGWVDPPGERPGMTAARKSGSLSGLLIASYGTDHPALDERDWELLKEWNDKGMPLGQHVRR